MNTMADWLYGRSERSTYHTTMVNKVKSHLKRTCTQAGKEHGFVPGRITDAYGYDKVTNTIYFCEIKVNSNDLLKAITQLHATSSNYTPKNPDSKIIPVIAIPKKLALGLSKYKPLDWKSFRLLCKNNKTAIWIIEQSGIVQIQGPKPKAPKAKVKKTIKAKKSTTIKAKKKTIKKRKPVTKTAITRKPSRKTKSKTKPKSIKKPTKTKTRKSVTKRASSPRKVTKKQ